LPKGFALHNVTLTAFPALHSPSPPYTIFIGRQNFAQTMLPVSPSLTRQNVGQVNEGLTSRAQLM